MFLAHDFPEIIRKLPNNESCEWNVLRLTDRTCELMLLTFGTCKRELKTNAMIYTVWCNT